MPPTTRRLEAYATSVPDFQCTLHEDRRAKSNSTGYSGPMRSTLLSWRGGASVGILPLIILVATKGSGAETTMDLSPVVTNVAQLRQAVTPEPGVSYSFQLEGDIWWSNPAQSRFILHD